MTLRDKRIDLLIGLGIFAISLLLFSLEWPYSLSNLNFDLRGGVSTVGASRVLAGEIPYRDFWTLYAPGHFYLLALLFRLFGEKLMVEVVAASIISAAAISLCYTFITRLVQRRSVGLASAGIFLAIIYAGGTFRRLTSYTPAIFFILLSYVFLQAYYQRKERMYILLSGMATGMVVIFKHDVGGYTAIAIFAGLLIYNLRQTGSDLKKAPRQWSSLWLYPLSAAIPALLVFISFAIIDGNSMFQDLVVFPLTDFRYSRPEKYPSLLPTGLLAASPVDTIQNVTNYFIFLIPSLLFAAGLASLVLAFKQQRTKHLALGVTALTGFLLHYGAAHVQINTHIITMSFYSLFAAALFYDLVQNHLRQRRNLLLNLVGLALISGWFLTLIARPAYLGWRDRGIATAKASLPKVQGFRLPNDEEQALADLFAYVKTQMSPEEKLFVGLNRHDVVIIGDVMVYFLLDQPIATRYHELHPAIADTAVVQQEMIKSLQEDEISLIILKNIFPDEFLENVKANFLMNLPQIGATDLDSFIREKYVKSHSFGPYETWILREEAATSAGN